MLPHPQGKKKIVAGTNSKNRSTCCKIAAEPPHGAHLSLRAGSFPAPIGSREKGQQVLPDRVDKLEGGLLQGVLPEADHARRTCRW